MHAVSGQSAEGNWNRNCNLEPVRKSQETLDGLFFLSLKSVAMYHFNVLKYITEKWK